MSYSYDAYISSVLYDRRYPAPNRRTLRRLLRLMPAEGRFMDFGAGTGALLAWPVLRCAAAMLSEMASFESAGVSGPV